ncbi:MAG: hypothetical protein JWQ35_2080 [Bacteriovoracaceae bacterium]|nr:hypothetical protein [Bacteriovoracaceae bacterium]
MFGMSLSEFFLLALIVLVLIGPKQLPDVMKTLGKIARELSKARRDLTKTIDQDDSFRSIKESVNDVKKSVSFKVSDLTSSLLDEKEKKEVTIEDEETRVHE